MEPDKKCIALIVAAGHGVRAGEGLPKQYRLLAGKPVLRRTIEAFLGHAAVSQVQVVISPEHRLLYDEVVAGLSLSAPILGGASRQDSVRLGLEALRDTGPALVLIHDAARALVEQETITAVVAALTDNDGAVPVTVASDTLKRVNQTHIEVTVPREAIALAQTPQGFHFKKIMSAHAASRDRIFTDDASIAEAAGMAIAVVQGTKSNFKLTTPEDFVIAERLLAANLSTRTGQGFDVHKFGPGDHIWLCGIRIPHTHGMIGHSDADAGLHALTDALLGAASLGDIGEHFPPTDNRWKGAASELFLRHAAKLISDLGGRVEHVDVTLICERPKVSPYRQAMVARIAQILGLQVSRVSVKATTTEGLGFTGRNEGIAAQAIATVRLP
ncbi:MAG: bifunctional 2-C-methyl-D-erythritol 4-phosphate cytidylyltransferase/2-C-methyl-D-erythritol 2,4-cyclodiphosphate synthase [Micropepsaceae bacterium]